MSYDHSAESRELLLAGLGVGVQSPTNSASHKPIATVTCGAEFDFNAPDAFHSMSRLKVLVVIPRDFFNLCELP